MDNTDIPPGFGSSAAASRFNTVWCILSGLMQKCPGNNSPGTFRVLRATRLHIEHELHDVPIVHHVVFAFHTDFAVGFGFCHGAVFHEVIE